MLSKFQSDGMATLAEHLIKLLQPDTTPVNWALYRAAPKTQEFNKAKIDKMVFENIMKPAHIEWATPTVFVPKRHETLQFYLDYHKLNAVTAQDSYPLLSMDKCVDLLGKVNVFSTLGPSSGYWQIKIEDADKDASAITFHHGLYRFFCMPVGLRNATSTFHGSIEVIISSVKW